MSKSTFVTQEQCEKLDIKKGTESVAIEDQRPVLEQLIDIYKKNGALEFLDNLRTKWREVEFSDDLYENYEEKRNMLEGRGIPEGVGKFKITSPEQMWATVCEIVSYEDRRNPNKVVFEDENGKVACIMLKGKPFLQSNGEIRQKVMYTIDKQKLEFELILSKTSKNINHMVKHDMVYNIFNVKSLHFLCEIDKIFGTHCIDRYIEDLLNLIDKNLEVDLHGTVNCSIEINIYAFSLDFIVSDSMIHTRADLDSARFNYYKHKHAYGQEEKMGYLKVKSEDMIPVETHRLPENIPIKLDDKEH